jgi:ABC-type enterochelin transport system substrate-binding protein
LDKHIDAISDYSNAIQLDLDNQMLLREPASEWRKLGELAKAEADEKKATELENHHKSTRDYICQEKDAALHDEALRKNSNN